MLGTTGIYASKKRKKPVQRSPKAPPPEGAKSNPSKRHRDRLNGELDKLTSLLPFPEDVRSRLDKLSVLRLSVGYLKAKSFFGATLKNGCRPWSTERSAAFGGNSLALPAIDGVTFSEGDLLLKALNGFVLVVSAEGSIFYTSPTIQDYLGFLQSDVLHQSVFELIHTDDRATFKSQLHFALNPSPFDEEGGEQGVQSNGRTTSSVVTYDPHRIPPENSSFLERSFVCRFRCLLDNSSGFLALNFQGRLKYLHGQNRVADDGTMAHPQLALFAIATPLRSPSVMDIRIKTFLFQTKHKLDFTPMAIDNRGKVILGYNEIELCVRGSGYQFIHAADMMHCADNHIRMIKTGESGLTVFRLLTKSDGWVWVQANARLVFKGGRPDFIVASQRALSNKEGEEHFRQRKMQLPFNLSSGEAVLYEIGPTLDIPDVNGRPTKVPDVADGKTDPNSLLGLMLKQDQSAYLPKSHPQLAVDQVFMESHAVLNVPGDTRQHDDPALENGLKTEVPAKVMLETLENILDDCDALRDLDVDVDVAELEEWEDALLKMSISGTDMAMDLDTILNDDILSFVEDTFFTDKSDTQYSSVSNQSNSLASSSFVGTSQCLQVSISGKNNTPTFHQNSFHGGPKNQLMVDPQVGLMVMNKQNLLGTENPALNSEELMFLGINGSNHQTQSDEIFTQFWDTTKVNPQNSFNSNGATSLDPALSRSCSQVQNQVRNSSNHIFSHTSKESLGLCAQQPIQPAPQVQLNATSLSLQNHLQSGMVAQPVGFQQPNNTDATSPMVSNQNRQWLPPTPTAPLGTILPQQQTMLSPSPANCFQGQLYGQMQNHQTHRHQSWQHQRQFPSVQNEVQPLPSCSGDNIDFQRAPLSGLSTQQHRARHRPETTPGTLYCPQPGLADPTPPPSSSCMFASNSPAPRNGVRFGHEELLSCQNIKFPHSQTAAAPPCYYQGNSSGILSAPPSHMVQEDNLSCRMTSGFSPEVIKTQQQYQINQTEIPSSLTDENGMFSFPPLTNGTHFLPERNQSNCCDF